eukprot:Skav215551  [mRNA]  locus=scaffold3091:141628:145172:- [translate_table: standard]
MLACHTKLSAAQLPLKAAVIPALPARHRATWRTPWALAAGCLAATARRFRSARMASLGAAEGAEISLKRLVSQCVDLAQRAGAQIRAACFVQMQWIFWFLHVFAGVEEDGDAITISTPNDALLDGEWPSDVVLPLAQLCYYEYVSTLIGISCRGRAVAGVISEPYSKDRTGQQGRILWGCCERDPAGTVPGVHVFGDAQWQRPERPDGRCLTLVSRSRASGEVADALQRLGEPGTAPKEPVEIIGLGLPGQEGDAPIVRLGELPLITDTQRAGGAGHKVARVVDGAADLWLFPRPGTSRWDTCAAEAMLEASGGALRNRFGQRIFYDPDGAMGNTEGVLAAASVGILSAARQVCSTLDVARDLEGRPLSRQWLGEALQQAVKVEAFTVTSFVRSEESCTLRLSLRYGSESDTHGLPANLTFKRGQNSMEPMFFEKFASRFASRIRLPQIFYNTGGNFKCEDSASSFVSILLMEELAAEPPFRECTDSIHDLKMAVAAIARFHSATLGDEEFLSKMAAEDCDQFSPPRENRSTEDVAAAALQSWKELVNAAAETPEEADRWLAETGIEELISRVFRFLAEKRRPNKRPQGRSFGCDAWCLIHGNFIRKNIIIDDSSATPMNFTHLRVGHPALDIAYLLTSFQCFELLDQLLEEYWQTLTASSGRAPPWTMAQLRSDIYRSSLALIDTPMQADLRELKAWIMFLRSFLEDASA